MLVAAFLFLLGAGFFVVGCLGVGAAIAGEMTGWNTVYAAMTAMCGAGIACYGVAVWLDR